MILLLAVQTATGLIIAGADLFYPPFGHRIAKWIAAPGVDPATLEPCAKDMYDKTAYQEMRTFRSAVLGIRLYAFYTLLSWYCSSS